MGFSIVRLPGAFFSIGQSPPGFALRFVAPVRRFCRWLYLDASTSILSSTQY